MPPPHKKKLHMDHDTPSPSGSPVGKRTMSTRLQQRRKKAPSSHKMSAIERYSALGAAARLGPASLPVRLPADRPRPMASNTYQHPVQKMLSEQFRDGYRAVLSQIEELEVKYAPTSGSSRLKEHEWLDDGLMLMASIERDQLRSLLSNTYIADAIWNKWLQPTGRPTMKLGAKPTDPSIYGNYISPADGIPLTVGEFRVFLYAIFVLSGMVSGRHKNHPDVRDRFRDKGKNLGARMREAWNSYMGYEVTHEEEKLASQRMEDSQKVNADGFAFGDSDGESETEDESQDASQPLYDEPEPMAAPYWHISSSAKSQLHKFHTIWTERLEGIADDKYMPIPAEAGWSMFPWLRWRQHRILSETPEIFKTVYLLLLVVFPEKNFTIFQFNIFSAIADTHAAYGESLASHLLVSYGNYGGFNFKQAGISVNSAYDTESGPAWRRAGELADEFGWFDRLDSNIAEEEQRGEQQELEEKERRAEIVLQRYEHDTDETKERHRWLDVQTELQEIREYNAVRREVLQSLEQGD